MATPAQNNFFQHKLFSIKTLLRTQELPKFFQKAFISQNRLFLIKMPQNGFFSSMKWGSSPATMHHLKIAAKPPNFVMFSPYPSPCTP